MLRQPFSLKGIWSVVFSHLKQTVPKFVKIGAFFSFKILITKYKWLFYIIHCVFVHTDQWTALINEANDVNLIRCCPHCNNVLSKSI